MEGKVTIVNTINARVGIDLPDIHFSHTWAKKGDKFTVTHDIFDAMMYDTGAHNMFEKGILYTEDMEVKKEYGLEPEDAEEPVNIIILSEAQMKRYLSVMPFRDFKAELDKVSDEQVVLLAQYAIANKITPDINKKKYIQDRAMIDIYKVIEENQRDEEAAQAVKK